ncbi:MAG: hypothetical protein R3248_14745 [Candidatus Promineifilaceae bacterium]|nr:hypothetical protein [Candidatus Promineifilaceae bacterium]
MNESLTSILWVAISLPILLVLERWIHRHLHGLAYLLTGRRTWAVLLYALILFPGVLLHEFSHWITALVLRVRTGSISLIPRVEEDGSVRLGYVEYYRGKTLDPLRETLVGGAPLISGTVAILLIGFYVFDVAALGAAVRTGEVAALTRTLEEIFRTPDFFVWLYLIFAVSNAMMPSPSDRRAWPAFLGLLAVGAVVLALLRVQDAVFMGLVGPVTAVFGYLGLAFSLAIGVDVLFILFIYVVERLVGTVKGVEVVYERPQPPAGR